MSATSEAVATDRWAGVPEPVREPFGALWNEVVRLNFRWNQFKLLYVSGQRRVDLLNEVAGGFFHQLQFIQLDDVVLAAARLLDPARTMGEENLSLPLLAERAVEAGFKDAKGVEAGESKSAAKLRALLDEATAITAPLRKHRHKRIAHADYRSHHAIVGSVLPGITPNLIDKVLAKIVELMNFVEFEFVGSTTAHQAVDSLSDADTLVVNLRRAADWKDLVPDHLARRERLMNDRYHGA